MKSDTKGWQKFGKKLAKTLALDYQAKCWHRQSLLHWQNSIQYWIVEGKRMEMITANNGKWALPLLLRLYFHAYPLAKVAKVAKSGILLPGFCRFCQNCHTLKVQETLGLRRNAPSIGYSMS